jgi:hypothetical protein
MRPFTPTEVAKYLLWVVLALALTAILAWHLFLTPGHERIHSGHEGATVQLRLPDAPHAVLRPEASLSLLLRQIQFQR